MDGLLSIWNDILNHQNKQIPLFPFTFRLHLPPSPYLTKFVCTPSFDDARRESVDNDGIDGQ